MRITMGIWIITWFIIWQMSANSIEIPSTVILSIGYIVGYIASHFIRQENYPKL